MKLTDVNIDGYGVCRNLRLSQFGAGLNIIYGGNGSGKTTACRYIRNVLFGFDHDATPSHGDLILDNDSKSFRLSRPDSLAGKLYSECLSPSHNSSQQAGWSNQMDKELYDAVYNLDFRDARRIEPNIAALLVGRFDVSLGDSGLEAEAEFLKRKSDFDASLLRLEYLNRKTTELESDHFSVQSTVETMRAQHQTKQSRLDQEIRQLTHQVSNSNLQSLRDSVVVLERQIAVLREQLDHAGQQVEYVPTHQDNDGELTQLYLRLDEIELQIRRWRIVQSNIQTERVRLRDEMLAWSTMDTESPEHAYHVATKLLTTLEQFVGQTELTVCELIDQDKLNPAETESHPALSLCSRMRQDLNSLSTELTARHLDIRHTSATAEFKHLRQCYSDMGDSLKHLLDRRELVVNHIQQIDQHGADAILRADDAFSRHAQSEGYLAARIRFVGASLPVSQRTNYRAVQPDLSVEDSRLADLLDQRTANIHRLVELENELSPVSARLETLRVERDRFGFLDISELESRRRMLQDEVQNNADEIYALKSQIEQDRLQNWNAPNSIISRASKLIERLTLGEIDQVWIAEVDSPDQLGIVARGLRRERMPFVSLSSGSQQQVVLGLCLAIVEYVADTGVHAPMLLDDVWVNLDPNRVASTFETLADYCQPGIQIVAVTAERDCLHMARNRNITVFELPETGVSPAPFITPDRTPTPLVAPPRGLQFTQAVDLESLAPRAAFESYPLHKYQNTPIIQSHAPQNFDAVSRPELLEFAPTIDETTPLRNFELIQPVFLTTLSESEVVSVGDLLDLTPTLLTQVQKRRGLTPEIVDRWQSIIWLMICVPGLRITDAQILMANGISEPEQLDTTASSHLHDRIARYLGTADGSRFANSTQNYTTDKINRWFRALDRTRARWRDDSGYSRQNRTLPSRSTIDDGQDRNVVREIVTETQRKSQLPTQPEPLPSGRPFKRSTAILSSLPAEKSARKPRLGIARTIDPGNDSRRIRKKQAKPNPNTEQLKFYLDLTDHIEAAPSIGVKTAEKFEKVGAKTISEFLDRTAESMATNINYKRITADIVRQWQHQTRLVCRVPNLRGHDAQLLVACGITEPEELAGMNPNDLFDIIGPFAETKEGLKIVRSGKQPDLAEIKNWIKWAADTRSLVAA